MAGLRQRLSHGIRSSRAKASGNAISEIGCGVIDGFRTYRYWRSISRLTRAVDD